MGLAVIAARLMAPVPNLTAMAPSRPPVKILASAGDSRWSALAAIGAGGLLGSAARSGLGLLIEPGIGGFPTRIVLVNLVGSLLLGLYVARRERTISGPRSLQFWGIGVIGSFTTFSTFSIDLVYLLEAGEALAAIGYASLSLLGGLTMALAGLRAGRAMR